ncbi:MAG: homoserine kinase [Gammaproteobacteria bacterium]|nr:homoserine kinase [Gammaproteobacteria bacterium]
MKIKIFSPATIGNVGPGFDVLGVAIDGLGDIVIAEKIAEKKFEFIPDKDFPDLPSDDRNVVCHVAKLVSAEYGVTEGIRITLKKNIPLSSGLGGSAASSAAAAFAVNELLGGRLTRQQLIPFAVEGERLASGSMHADNVAPALLGGLCLLSGDHDKPQNVTQLPLSNIFYWTVVHPHFELETRVMRSVLPKTITLSEHTTQSGYFGLLLSGLLVGNSEWVRQGLCDLIIEPKRASFIPGFDAAREAALKAGALGFSISGAGPSVFAISDTQMNAERVAIAIQIAFKQSDLDSDVFISKTNLTGTKRI